MFAVSIALLLTAAPAGAAPHEVESPAAEASGPADLSTALRAADVAEIYDLRGIQFPTAPRPDMVRDSGCKYGVYRAGLKGDSRWWRDLEHSLKQVDTRLRPSSDQRQVRIGLVLSDARGTLWEIYLDDLPGSDGRVSGFEQRRSVRASASLAEALKGYVARHPELILTPSRGDHYAHCPPRPPLLFDTE